MSTVLRYWQRAILASCMAGSDSLWAPALRAHLRMSFLDMRRSEFLSMVLSLRVLRAGAVLGGAGLGGAVLGMVLV